MSLISSRISPLLDDFLSAINALDNTIIHGVYLTGSIPLDDFHPDKSDIDFVVVLESMPDSTTKQQLEKMHNILDRQFGRPKLSGIYLDKEGLDFKNLKTNSTFAYDDGKMHYRPFDMGPITLFELKSTAITLSGIKSSELPIQISTDDVNQFLHENLNTYWKNWVTQHSFPNWRHSLLILFPRLTEWVLLGIARQLYTLQSGKIISKTEAGHFILDHLPEKFHRIVREAIDIRNDTRHHLLTLKSSYTINPSLRRASETLACARYMLEHEKLTK